MAPLGARAKLAPLGARAKLAPLGARAKFVGTCLLQDAAEIASAVSVILVRISVSAMLLLIDVLGTLARVARSSCSKKSNRLFVVFKYYMLDVFT